MVDAATVTGSGGTRLDSDGECSSGQDADYGCIRASGGWGMLKGLDGLLLLLPSPERRRPAPRRVGGSKRASGGESMRPGHGPCGRMVAAARGDAHLLGASTTSSTRTPAPCVTGVGPTGGRRPHAAWERLLRADDGSGPRERATGAGADTAAGNGDGGACLFNCDCPGVLLFGDILDLADRTHPVQIELCCSADAVPAKERAQSTKAEQSSTTQQFMTQLI